MIFVLIEREHLTRTMINESNAKGNDQAIRWLREGKVALLSFNDEFADSIQGFVKLSEADIKRDLQSENENAENDRLTGKINKKG